MDTGAGTTGRVAALTTLPREKPRKGFVRRRRKEYLLFIAFAIPNIVIISVFGLWPVLYTAYLSFTDWDMVSPSPTFVGLENYVFAFTSPDFGHVLLITLIYVVVVVVAGIVLGLLAALLLNQRLRGTNVVRTLTFSPYVLSGAAVAMIWVFLLDSHYGISRAIFALFGQSSPEWTTDPSWALLGVTITSVWKDIGFSAIVYVAALQGLPKDLYEAAALDGASRWQQLTKLTIPLLSPTTFFLVVMGTIGASKAFDVIMVMTGGGPAKSTQVLSIFIYNQAFQAFHVGEAAAAAMILFAFLLIAFALQRLLIERKVHYQ